MNIQRNIFEQLKQHLPYKEYSILVGARQIGKSTLLRQLEIFCKVENIPCTFLNLENKAVLAQLDEHPLNLINFLPGTDSRTVVFIDEVQYLKDPSNFLKLIYDEYAERIKIVATGSSAFYIDKSFNDSLAGRKRLFKLHTCSFDEHLRLSGREDLLYEVRKLQQNVKARSASIEELRNEWYGYMLYGGYPAVVKERNVAEKVNRLREIRDSYVKRDVLEAGVQNEIAFYNLFRMMAAHPGSLINVSELSKVLRIKDETVQHYLFVLQKCFHVALVKPFFRNVNKELVKMPKAYLMDAGVRNSLISNFQPVPLRLDKGELWENACYRLLADIYPSDEVFFWRTADRNEVDFVLPNSEPPCAIEVKYNADKAQRGKYKKFEDMYPDMQLYFACMEPFRENFFRSFSSI
ncbi:MAG: ATP-binding protein [Prevotellaceae bacterium]|jgi:predicted AAA+ superfamily ATPase|nr:ATP-binding protein [Prevotellaceae bacterium]